MTNLFRLTRSTRVLGASLLLFTLSYTSIWAGEEMLPAKTSKSVSTVPDAKDMLKKPLLTEVKPSDWQFKVGIPGWMPGVEGEVGVRNVTGDLDIGFDDLLRHIKAVAVLGFEIRHDKWAFAADGLYMKVADNLETRDIIFDSANITFEQAIVNFALSYRFIDTPRITMDASVGGRFQYIGMTLDLETRRTRIPSQSREDSRDWVDPIIGINTTVQIYKPLAFTFKGDVGGFGVGSELTYQLYAGLDLQLSRRFYASLGYRYMSTDYTDGDFKWDVSIGGPQLECGVKF
ncbi:MAG: hypothetical protein ACAI35_28190 [Candidatus Methylacidiphilales bacterium]|nr:hypothetical protein [Candidatus Methylacidiphilales bacterium]